MEITQILESLGQFCNNKNDLLGQLNALVEPSNKTSYVEESLASKGISCF